MHACDVLIIGAGVIGASIFRELSKYNLNFIAIEKENDVAMGATKANSAIIHAGFDPEPGTAMARYNVLGSKMYKNICAELDVPYENNGAMVVAFSENDLDNIKKLQARGIQNGVQGLEILNKHKTLEKEPNLNKKIIASLYINSSAIICPFQYTIALFENGILNGGKLYLNEEVTKIENFNSEFVVSTKSNGIYRTKFIVNAAGIYADKIHNMVLKEDFSISPRRGEYIIFNKDQGKLFNSTIFQCPSKHGKGVLVSKTVHGNLFVGPNAVDIEDKNDTEITKNGIDYIKNMAKLTSEKIDFSSPLKSYAGLRAMSSTGDFIVKNYSNMPNFIDVAGIKSPGLSSAPAIAKDVLLILKDAGLAVKRKSSFDPIRRRVKFLELSDEEKNEIIKKNSSFGKIICSCEGVTEAEILDAMNKSFSNLPTVCSIKRRCRAGMGRCQGNYCASKIVKMIAKRYNIPENFVCLDSLGSNILSEKVK